jgi:FKBP-type peptidyl-prolyl cis-trans isomerase
MCRMMIRSFLAAACVVAVSACTLKDESLAQPPDAIKTSSGLASKVLRAGQGSTRPTMTSSVKVHYTGWTTDGRQFDSSVDSGTPIEFRLTGVIPGWTEGLQLMVVGEKRRFWIPGHLAYDTDPRPNVPKGLLIFDIELLDIK